MLISLDWIKDFSPLPADISSEDFAKRVTLGVAEVEEVIESGAHFRKIRVAEITSLEKHPDADKLNLVSFDIGGESRKVVCGAPNVKVGLKVPFAPLGTTLPGGFTLTPKKIRGVLSEGMLCSAKELGLGEGTEGLMELDSKMEVGLSLDKAMELKADTLLDIDNKSLTHRPDLWGHYGMAQEVAALYKCELRKPYGPQWMNSLKEKSQKQKAPLEVSVKGGEGCLGYFGLSLSEVMVGESPSWMQERLEKAGLRSINNIVDISNYVMLELGHPLHIFDRDKITGPEVRISALDSATDFETLDGVQRRLEIGDLVISDGDGPLVLAGIMGGDRSSVSEKTTELFIEVANWDAPKVRRTSTRLGLRTDSSSRFEKSLDSLQCEQTLWRTVDLILEICPGAKVCGDVQYDGPNLSETPELIISLEGALVRETLGHPVSDEEILDILGRLDFTLEASAKGCWNVRVPSYRSTKDIECQADLVEEIGRVIGYDNITPRAPLVGVFPTKRSVPHKLHNQIKDFLAYNGKAFEVMTYPLTGKKLREKSLWTKGDDRYEIINSLSSDQSELRDSLIPGMLEASAKNAKNFNQFKMFELGRVYGSDHKSKKGQLFKTEANHLIISFYHQSETPFMKLVDCVESLAKHIGLPMALTEASSKFDIPFCPQTWGGLHPFEQRHMKIMGRAQGIISSVHPLLLKKWKMKGHLSFALIDLSQFEVRGLKSKKSFTPLSKYPSSSFDWTVLSSEGQTIGPAFEAIAKLKIKELISLEIVGRFSSGDGPESITLRATFHAEDQTLSGELIESLREKMMKACRENGLPLKS